MREALSSRHAVDSIDPTQIDGCWKGEMVVLPSTNSTMNRLCSKSLGKQAQAHSFVSNPCSQIPKLNSAISYVRYFIMTFISITCDPLHLHHSHCGDHGARVRHGLALAQPCQPTHKQFPRSQRRNFLLLVHFLFNLLPWLHLLYKFSARIINHVLHQNKHRTWLKKVQPCLLLQRGAGPRS
jgi:hypothetical protein